MNLFEKIAMEIFIADGGVDDFEELDDAELARMAAFNLRAWANDAEFLGFIVEAARKVGKEMTS